jgi:hypothetical protein
VAGRVEGVTTGWPGSIPLFVFTLCRNKEQQQLALVAGRVSESSLKGLSFFGNSTGEREDSSLWSEARIFQGFGFFAHLKAHSTKNGK